MVFPLRLSAEVFPLSLVMEFVARLVGGAGGIGASRSKSNLGLVEFSREHSKQGFEVFTRLQAASFPDALCFIAFN